VSTVVKEVLMEGIANRRDSGVEAGVEVALGKLKGGHYSTSQ
jgi:hypothetical protein